ncbi:hypothetical protein ACTXPS_20090, partial [Brachybacterium tyrofermentans]|uniref:hypothetical protein n=1 Tax=Brachybacterium tyrofermentans TaxID=47848 RepID=UPI003FD1A20D
MIVIGVRICNSWWQQYSVVGIAEAACGVNAAAIPCGIQGVERRVSIVGEALEMRHLKNISPCCLFSGPTVGRSLSMPRAGEYGITG